MRRGGPHPRWFCFEEALFPVSLNLFLFLETIRVRSQQRLGRGQFESWEYGHHLDVFSVEKAEGDYERWRGIAAAFAKQY
jgi:hypothetical protein